MSIDRAAQYQKVVSASRKTIVQQPCSYICSASFQKGPSNRRFVIFPASTDKNVVLHVYVVSQHAIRTDILRQCVGITTTTLSFLGLGNWLGFL